LKKAIEACYEPLLDCSYRIKSCEEELRRAGKLEAKLAAVGCRAHAVETRQ
jgi:hypothetical protein